MPEEKDSIISPDRLLLRIRRKTISLSFLGADIYIASFIMLQLVYLFYTGMISIMSGSELDIYSDRVLGILSIVCVIIGVSLALVYFFLIDKSYGIFGFIENADGSFVRIGLVRSVFSHNKMMGIQRAAECVGIVLLFQVLGTLINSLIETVLNGYGMTTLMSPAATADYTVDVLLILYSTLLGPCAEELIYRGLLLRPLARYGKTFAILVSAVVFALMHGDIYQLVFTFAMGILFAYVALEYSIWHSLLLHIFNNGVLGFILPYLMGLLDSEIMYSLLYLVGVLLILRVLVLLLSRFRDIIAYLRENMCDMGTIACLFNVWFILFVFWELFEIFMSITPI